MSRPSEKNPPNRSRDLTLKEKLELSIEWEAAKKRRREAAQATYGGAVESLRPHLPTNEAGGTKLEGPRPGELVILYRHQEPKASLRVRALVMLGMVLITWGSIIGVYYLLRWAGW